MAPGRLCRQEAQACCYENTICNKRLSVSARLTMHQGARLRQLLVLSQGCKGHYYWSCPKSCVTTTCTANLPACPLGRMPNPNKARRYKWIPIGFTNLEWWSAFAYWFGVGMYIEAACMAYVAACYTDLNIYVYLCAPVVPQSHISEWLVCVCMSTCTSLHPTGICGTQNQLTGCQCVIRLTCLPSELHPSSLMAAVHAATQQLMGSADRTVP